MRLRLESASATEALAREMANLARPGDAILLAGPIGSGKTVFARAFIRALLPPGQTEAEVPSPTFTLVQTYRTRRAEIWHVDLYRLDSAEEAVELGLSDAFPTAICLVEWPDRLGWMAPDGALHLEFALTDSQPDARDLDIAAGSPEINRLMPQAGRGFR